MPSLRLAALAVFVILVGAPGAGLARSAEGRAAEVRGAELRPAFAALERRDWGALAGLSSRIGDPLAGKLLFWLQASQGDAPVGFAAVDAFLAANPAWPGRTAMLRRAEELLPAEKSPRAVVAWFGEREPLTPYGRFRLALALLELGDRQRAGELARRSWRGGDLYYPDLERTFRATFAPLLSAGDHRARLDALLWEGRESAARRLFDVVDADRRALAQARILLRRQKGNADAALAAVPPALRHDPGLTYERIRWRRQKGQEARRARSSPRSSARCWPPRPVVDRAPCARPRCPEPRAGGGGLPAGAPPRPQRPGRLCRGRMACRLDCLALFEAAAGRPRSLSQNGQGGSLPISVARAAYRASRAGEAAGDKPFAMAWYRTAAAHPTTFYGRLAAERVSPETTLTCRRRPNQA